MARNHRPSGGILYFLVRIVYYQSEGMMNVFAHLCRGSEYRIDIMVPVCAFQSLREEKQKDRNIEETR